MPPDRDVKGPEPTRRRSGRRQPIISNRLESNFSPYELAVMSLTIGPPLLIISFIAFLTGRIAGGIALGALALAIHFVFRAASECPACGKAPFIESGFSWFELYVLKGGQRIWPERRCSRCGTALDVIPDDRR